MISAPRSARSAGESVLTVACVPTGMNTGVWTSPWDVVILPRRAEASSFINEKLNDIIYFGLRIADFGLKYHNALRGFHSAIHIPQSSHSLRCVHAQYPERALDHRL